MITAKIVYKLYKEGLKEKKARTLDDPPATGAYVNRMSRSLLYASEDECSTAATGTTHEQFLSVATTGDRQDA